MVPVEMLSPGMRVKIVDEWCFGCFPNAEGLMDKYLGQIVTILDVDGQYVRIEEDAGDCNFQEGGHWSWGAHSFDCIVEGEDQEDFEVSSKDEIFSFIFGNYIKKGVRPMKYRVQCVRYGFADVEAESEEAAIDMAESLPNSAYSWSDADDHEVIDRLDS